VIKLLTVEALGALVPGIDKMSVDEARAACKAHDRAMHAQLIHSWNEHYGRALLKHAHKEMKAKRHARKAGARVEAKTTKRGG
jgi:hypothetical protein